MKKKKKKKKKKNFTNYLRGAKQIRNGSINTRVWNIRAFNLVGNVVIAAECLHTTRTLGEERHDRVVLQVGVTFNVFLHEKHFSSVNCTW